VLCIWWKKLNGTGGYSGIAAGFTTFVAIKVMFPEFPASFVGFLVSISVAMIVSLLTQNSDRPVPLTDADGEQLELSNRLGTLPLFRRSN
jgi:Na+/proline symporter